MKNTNSSKLVIHTLSYINQEFGKTIVMVTHDPQMASYCNRLILLNDEVTLEALKSSGEQEALYESWEEKDTNKNRQELLRVNKSEDRRKKQNL